MPILNNVQIQISARLVLEPLVGSPLEIQLLYFSFNKNLRVPIPVIQLQARFVGFGLSIHCSSYNL